MHNKCFSDDLLTRFHQHCFDTNRLYLDDVSKTSENAALAINNYRIIRKDNKKPREFQSYDDEIYYKASNNRHIFISQRFTFFILPLFAAGWCLSMADVTFGYRMYILYSLLIADIVTIWWGNKINDVCIGASYFIATVVVVFLYDTSVL